MFSFMRLNTCFHSCVWTHVSIHCLGMFFFMYLVIFDYSCVLNMCFISCICFHSYVWTRVSVHVVVHVFSFICLVMCLVTYAYVFVIYFRYCVWSYVSICFNACFRSCVSDVHVLFDRKKSPSMRISCFIEIRTKRFNSLNRNKGPEYFKLNLRCSKSPKVPSVLSIHIRKCWDNFFSFFLKNPIKIIKNISICRNYIKTEPKTANKFCL